jgi:NAD+-dependent secondary alcohol dehydrogenase Adh1
MKAIRVHSYGQPPRLDDVPEPQVTGPDDVIVRIGGAGLCRTDLHIIDGWFADIIPSELPLVLGHENAGWIHAVGPAVDHLAVGDAVICHPNLTCGVCRACRAGDDMRCARGPDLPGLTRAGGMAELFKTRSRAIVKLVAGAEPAEVAALADAGLTAYHAVGKAVPLLGAGSSAVVVGVGGLGHIGIQCLKAVTMAQVIAVDLSEEALKLAMDCGADYLVTAGTQQVRQVRDLTGPGADAVFDFVGEDTTIGDSVAMLRPGGTYYLIGYGGTVTFPTVPLILGEISIVANLIGTGTDLADLVTLAGQGKVRLRSSSYPLEAASDAIQDLRHGRIHGRAILAPSTGISTLASRSGGHFEPGGIAWPRCISSTRSRTSVPGKPHSTGSRRRARNPGSAATASCVRSMTLTMSSWTWTSRPPARRRNSWASCRPRCGPPRRTPLPSPAPRRGESSNPLRRHLRDDIERDLSQTSPRSSR